MAGLRSRDVVNAAVDALRADATLTTLLGGTSKVYTHVPQDTEAPYVLVMAGREAPVLETFDDDASRSVEVMAMTVSTYRGTKEVDAVSDQCADTLTTHATYAGLAGYTANRFVEAERPTVEDVDGTLFYQRRVIVAVWVQ